MGPEYQIVITETGDGAKQATTDLQGVAATAKTVAGEMDNLTKSSGNNRLAWMELGHVARASAEGLAAGISPARLLALELPRIGQAALLSGVNLTNLIPAIAGVAAVVAGAVWVWSDYKNEQQAVIDRTNTMAAAFKAIPEVVKNLNTAVGAGVLSAADRQKYLDELGFTPQSKLQIGNPTFDPNFKPGPLAPQVNAMGGKPSLAAFGLPDPDAISQENEALAKAGILLKEIDEKGKASYSVSPQISALEQLNELQKKAAQDQLTGFDQERAAATKYYDDLIDKANAYIAVAGKKVSADDAAKTISGLEAAKKAHLDLIATKEVDLEIDRELQSAQAMLADIEASQAEDHKTAMEERQTLERQMTLDALTQGQERMQTFQDEHDRFVALVQDQFARGIISQREYTAAIQDADIKLLQHFNNFKTDSQKSTSQAKLNIQSWHDVGIGAANDFASGLSGAFVAFASGSESADKAFKKFAASFLQQIAQMILQTLILRAISGLFGGGGAVAGGTAQVSALGSVRFAAGGLSGVGSMNTPTYFPRFNTIGGEAGRELFTVLARPRLMEIGGIEAAVGYAGGNRLAVTNADQLAKQTHGGSGGGGGVIHIQIDHTPETQAKIISTAVDNAEVRVTQQMNRNTPLRQSVKKAVR